MEVKNPLNKAIFVKVYNRKEEEEEESSVIELYVDGTYRTDAYSDATTNMHLNQPPDTINYPKYKIENGKFMYKHAYSDDWSWTFGKSNDNVVAAYNEEMDRLDRILLGDE